MSIIQNEKDYQLDLIKDNQYNLENPSEIKSFKIKKYIAKLKKSNDKSYKQRPIMIVPIYQNRLNMNHSFILHGFIEIETQYKDYSDPQEVEMASLQSNLVSIKSIEKNYNLKTLVMNMETKGCCGLKDFQFLIDYFSKQPDTNFQQLTQCLIRHQEYLQQNRKYIYQLKQLINEKVINKQEIIDAMNSYQEYYFEIVKQHLKQDDFFIGCYCPLNIETEDIEPKQIIMSQALLNLFGIEMTEEQDLLHQLISFQNVLGKERLQETLSQLDYFSYQEGKKQYEYACMTTDNIKFRPLIEYEYVDWPQRPSYLQKMDLGGIILKYNVPLYQLKQIIQIRNENQPKTSQSLKRIQDLLEYQIQTEIFIEKFYPQLTKKQNDQEQLPLRKLNKQINKSS